MTQPNCPSCGAAIPAAGPPGFCPRCLLKRGMETNTAGFTAPEEDRRASRWQPPQVSQLASLFPELEITRLIGRGGMGAVYQARQRSLDRVVALKILPPEMGHDPAFAERFAREAQAMARLNHPHIVAIHEFGHRVGTPESRLEAGLYFFLMEYVDGVNLRGLMDSKHLSPKEALAIVPQICEALQYAHDQGIVHRDIKPENILLNKQGQVKIADFGLAKLIGKAEENSLHSGEPAGGSSRVTPIVTSSAGTPAYMAPEQLAHPADVDHRADIYALGVVFYQMLTGELPAKRLEPPSHKVQIDVRLDQIVLRAMEQSPELRFQNATQFKTEIETVISTHAPSEISDLKSEIPHPSPSSEILNRSAEILSSVRARNAFLIPVIGLRIAIIINIAFLVFALITSVTKLSTSPYTSTPYPTLRIDDTEVIRDSLLRSWRENIVLGFFVTVPALLLNVFILLATRYMRQLQHYTCCIVACILTLFAIPVFWLALPFGIWSLILLNRPYIKAAFDSAKTNDPQLSNLKSALPVPSPTAPKVTLIIAAAFHSSLFVLALAFFAIIVPHQVHYFAGFGATLPIATQWTISLSHFIQQWTFVFILPLLVSNAGLCFLTHYVGGRRLLRAYSLLLIAALSLLTLSAAWALTLPGRLAPVESHPLTESTSAPGILPSTPRLQFHLGRPPDDTTSIYFERPDPWNPAKPLQILSAIALDQSALADASLGLTPVDADPDPVVGSPAIHLFLTPAGAQTYALIPREVEKHDSFTIEKTPLYAFLDGQILYVSRVQSAENPAHLVVFIPAPASRTAAEQVVAKLKALAGVPLTMPPMSGPHEVLAQLPADARPASNGWDEFSKPKADHWLDDHFLSRGRRLVAEATVETLRWQVELILDPQPFIAQGTTIKLKLNSYDLPDPNATTVTIFEPRSVVTVSGTEEFARRAKLLQPGDKVIIKGAISKCAVWEASPPELWILLADPTLVLPAPTSRSVQGNGTSGAATINAER